MTWTPGRGDRGWGRLRKATAGPRFRATSDASTWATSGKRATSGTWATADARATAGKRATAGLRGDCG